MIIFLIAEKVYQHQSMFWSDLGPEIGYEGIGLVDASLPTVGCFALPSKSDRKADNLSGTPESGMVEAKNEPVECPPNIEKTENKESQSTNQPDTEDDYGRGVIFYLKNGKIVGILLWNLFNRIGLARAIINENKCYEDLNEVAKLFEIHS